MNVKDHTPAAEGGEPQRDSAMNPPQEHDSKRGAGCRESSCSCPNDQRGLDGPLDSVEFWVHVVKSIDYIMNQEGWSFTGGSTDNDQYASVGNVLARSLPQKYFQNDNLQFLSERLRSPETYS